MQAAKFPSVSVSSFGVSTVDSVFIGHIPIRKYDHARRQSLTLSSLFGVSDFEVNVIAILEVLIEPALKSIGPFCVVLYDVFEVVEELAVGIYASNFNARSSVTDKITLEESNRLQLFKAAHQSIERNVKINDLLKEIEFHAPPPAPRVRSREYSVRESKLLNCRSDSGETRPDGGWTKPNLM
jgi:hypothetical protein